MALNTAPACIGRQRASEAPTGNGRGRPSTVTMRRTTYAALLIEAMTLADDAIGAADRIHGGALLGSRQLVAHEAGRLCSRATAARDEFRRFAEGLEE